MQHSGFNPKARWDRHIPENPQSRQEEPEVNERIEVLTRFKGGRCLPFCFIWKNKEYAVKEITYHWQERHGQALISYFSVATDANLYQISFNNTTFSWRLDKIIE